MTLKELRASLALWRKRWRKARPGTPERVKAYRLVKRRKAQVADRERANAPSSRGVDFIASWEGFYPLPYNDGEVAGTRAFYAPGGRGHATIGYGTLLHHGPVTRADVKRWTSGVTRERARAMLRREVEEKAKAVDRLVKVPLNQAEYDALVSFAYNCGEGALASSTLLRRLNAGDRRGAADEFLKWTRAWGGGPVPGLVRRRKAERAMFLGQGYRPN